MFGAQLFQKAGKTAPKNRGAVFLKRNKGGVLFKGVQKFRMSYESVQSDRKRRRTEDLCPPRKENAPFSRFKVFGRSGLFTVRHEHRDDKNGNGCKRDQNDLDGGEPSRVLRTRRRRFGFGKIIGVELEGDFLFGGDIVELSVLAHIEVELSVFVAGAVVDETFLLARKTSVAEGSSGQYILYGHFAVEEGALGDKIDKRQAIRQTVARNLFIGRDVAEVFAEGKAFSACNDLYIVGFRNAEELVVFVFRFVKPYFRGLCNGVDFAFRAGGEGGWRSGSYKKRECRDYNADPYGK